MRKIEIIIQDIFPGVLRKKRAFENDLKEQLEFTAPIHARDPQILALKVEDFFIACMKEGLYDYISVLAGESDPSILKNEPLDLAEIKYAYKMAIQQHNPYLKMYPYLLKVFGPTKFKVKSSGTLMLDISLEDFNTKVLTQIDKIDFVLKSESFIVNLIYNIKLRFTAPKTQLQTDPIEEVDHKASVDLVRDVMYGDKLVESKEAKTAHFFRFNSARDIAMAFVKKKASSKAAKNLMDKYKVTNTKQMKVLEYLKG